MTATVNVKGRIDEHMPDLGSQSELVVKEITFRTRPFIGTGRIEVLLAADGGRSDGYVPQTGRAARLVQVLPLAALKSFFDPIKRTNLETKFGPVSKRCFSRLSYLGAFVHALRTHKFDVLLRAIASRAKQRRGKFDPSDLRSGVLDLGIELNEVLGDASFIVWWNSQECQYAPGFFCPNIESALGVLTYLEIARGGGVLFCRKPNCMKPFFPSRKKQKYCSPQCQAADGSARYRVRKEKGANL